MAPKKRERCERRRTATDAPWSTNVEVDDSAPIAGRVGPVPMPGAACATANDQPRAVLSPRARPRTDLRGQVMCTNIVVFTMVPILISAGQPPPHSQPLGGVLDSYRLVSRPSRLVSRPSRLGSRPSRLGSRPACAQSFSAVSLSNCSCSGSHEMSAPASSASLVLPRLAVSTCPRRHTHDRAEQRISFAVAVVGRRERQPSASCGHLRSPQRAPNRKESRRGADPPGVHAWERARWGSGEWRGRRV